jgi:hypothetical protein
MTDEPYLSDRDHRADPRELDDGPLASLPELSPEAEAYLAVRREEAKHVDPETAETNLWYGQTLDPYGVIPAMPEHLSQVGRECFARRPCSDIWVHFGDLDPEVRDKLWAKHSRKLASPAGLFGIKKETDHE